MYRVGYFLRGAGGKMVDVRAVKQFSAAKLEALAKAVGSITKKSGKAYAVSKAVLKKVVSTRKTFRLFVRRAVRRQQFKYISRSLLQYWRSIRTGEITVPHQFVFLH